MPGTSELDVDAAGRIGLTTLATKVYGEIREDIVVGVLPPGAKLKILLLKARYDCGATPIREALNRLSMERFVVHSANRGFTVAPISLADFDDIAQTRCMLYSLMIPLSIEHGDNDWEERVVLALHRLNRIMGIRPEPLDENPRRRQAHKYFHRSLVAAAPSNFLIEMLDILFDFSDRYRLLVERIAAGELSHQAPQQHEELANLVVARKAREAVRLAEAHVMTTANLLRSHIAKVESEYPQEGLDGDGRLWG